MIAAAVAAMVSVTPITEWKFALGHAGDPEKDFGCGTEYFNYLTKANSIHNEGPYKPDFDDSEWQDVTVPHDWVTTLPYAPEASHSHGYKMVGWKFPESSVGWYRTEIEISRQARNDSSQDKRHYELRFDGIFRDSKVWFNGFYLGGEPSGYAVQVYDVTPYIKEGKNVITVRADASFEEGWFYEGAGIYRNAWLIESGPVHPTPGGIWTEFGGSTLTLHVELENSCTESRLESLFFRLLDAQENSVWEYKASIHLLPQRRSLPYPIQAELDSPHMWSPEDPYLYTLETTVGEDVYLTKIGLRTAKFTAGEGFLLNGQKLTLKGVNLHQDHSGVGSAMTDDLIEWRVLQLKKLGVNAIRCSHNPASPALLDICDRLGMLVIDENRLMGINDYHKRELENMVRFGRSHPSVILWSLGNEEWGLENDPRGIEIVKQMADYVHLLDPSRQTTAANAGGGVMIEGFEIHGYNYIIQNDVENRHARHPEWPIYGSEETTGCGTRGIYYPVEGHMPSINRDPSYAWDPAHTPENVIERGWQFYRDHPWTGGVFFWTGFDYKGEPNPLQFPAVLSEFGILDYCGFPKDEAWYLKAAWTNDPVLHLFPHWNLEGHEGEAIDLWVYSNCDKVQLKVNGKNLGTKAVPKDGHVVFTAKYKAGKITAVGYKGKKKIVTQTIETTGPAHHVEISYERVGKLTVATAEVKDSKGRTVPTACNEIAFTLEGDGKIAGGGNGDPAWHGIEHCFDGKHFSTPAFNGLAQVLIISESEDVRLLPDLSL